MSPSISLEEEDEDPVVAEYDVHMTAEQPEQSFLLQYPNRHRSKPYGPGGETPVALRMKPICGFMEVDVQTNVLFNFDKRKGVQWGEALRDAKKAGAGSFGMASGFGKANRHDHFGAAAVTDRPPTDDFDQLVDQFGQSNAAGRVLNKQTLGGQIVRPGKGKPNYMLGAFRGKELHLTAIDGAIQMRPQFHHLDAQSTAARNKFWRDRDALDNVRAEPRTALHHQMVRNAADGEEFNVTNTAKHLTDAAEEQWVPLEFRDAESEEAYAEYRAKLFLSDTMAAAQLKATIAGEQYLDEISAPRVDPSGKTKRLMTKRQRLALDEESDGAPEAPETQPNMSRAVTSLAEPTAPAPAPTVKAHAVRRIRGEAATNG